MSEIDDAELLQIEMETLWGKDLYGRIEQRPQVVLLATSASRQTYVSGELPRDVAEQLEAVSHCAPAAEDPSQPPGTGTAIGRC